ncbi:hypothetical protein F4780DRAFT_639774 [Xylariomycetidae sp. FL0641]|nr:hypothetical protein F4780DRAFT_639774 [Xylariomycetidae sp. FL0641]
MAYEKSLRQRTASAFTEGRTSHLFRRVHFEKLPLLPCQIMRVMEQLLSTYQDAFITSLPLKARASDLYRTLKATGKKFAVIPNGRTGRQPGVDSECLG